MVAWLGTQGFEVNRKRVSRLMTVMGIEAVYPKPKLSIPGEGHKVYPYLLRGVGVDRVNQVWSTDITYIRMAQGFVYLVAVMAWFSRYVLSWRLSVSLEFDFCVEALRCALRRGRPEIFNTDQGSQFTSERFTGELAAREVAISMDGRGRCMDNIFIERLWRSLKYEEVYLKDYESVTEARAGIERYFRFYNQERLHQSLEYRTPATIWLARRLNPMTEQSIRNNPLLKTGTLSPNPWDLPLSCRNGWSYTGGTRTEDKAPQGCDPSAASSAGMAMGGFEAEAALNSNSDSSNINLLRAENGLDNGSTLSPGKNTPASGYGQLRHARYTGGQALAQKLIRASSSILCQPVAAGST